MDRLEDCRLSKKEREIAALVVEGHNYQTIKQKLHTPIGTIRIYRDRIHKKLHINSRLEMAVKLLSVTPESLKRSRLNLLSPREREIAMCIAQGCQNKEIAFRLSISVKGMKNRMSVIYRKTGAADRLALLRWLIAA